MNPWDDAIVNEWDIDKARINVLRDQYVNGDMDQETLRRRLQLYGYCDPWLQAEIDYCEELKREAS